MLLSVYFSENGKAAGWGGGGVVGQLSQLRNSLSLSLSRSLLNLPER